MKKLINLLEKNATVSSLNLSNTTTDNDTRNDLISPALLQDVNSAAASAGVNVVITTAISGHKETTSSGNPSRHPDGTAVDISIINGKAVSPSNRTDADSFVSKLKSMGYDTSGGESGHPKEVIWQTDNEHRTHIHVSNTTGVVSGGPGSTSSGSIDSDSRNTAKKFLVNMIGNTFGMNENKQERILKDIEKIKNLL